MYMCVCVRDGSVCVTEQVFPGGWVLWCTPRRANNRTMPRKAPPPVPRQGTVDMLQSRNSAVRARLGNDEKVSVDYIEACG